MPDLYREFITVEEIALVLLCTEHQVIELLRNGTLPGMKPGRSWVIPRVAFITAVNAWAERAAHDIAQIAQDLSVQRLDDELRAQAVRDEQHPSLPSRGRGRGRSRTVMPPFESLDRG